MVHDLQLSPEIIKLQDEILVLEKELAKIILEHEEMLNNVRPNLEAEYQKLVGYKELEQMETEINTRRCKRQLELLQASVNRQENIDKDEIEKKLDDEFREWFEKIEEQYQKIKEAEQRLDNLMSDKENKEFIKLYRKIVFKLHPDLNPNQKYDDKNLWHRVQLAYKLGDLSELRSLAILVDIQHKSTELPSSDDLLRKQKKQLAKQIQRIINKINKLEKTFPFNLINKLADNKWIDDRIKEIQDEIDRSMERQIYYENLIELFLISRKSGIN